MTEPVSLALGAVALVSLFSSCVELIEYFELGRSYEYDYDKACLKLTLLRSRLEDWGVSSQLGEMPSQRGDNAVACHWTPQHDVVDRSLRGIYDILADAEGLKVKYSLVPSKPRSTFLKALRSGGGSKKEKRPPLREARSGQTNLTRRSTTWAIKDKRKFDSLITDLDFFITNLESVLLSKSSGIYRKVMSPASSSHVEGEDKGQVMVIRGGSSGGSSNEETPAKNGGDNTGNPTAARSVQPQFDSAKFEGCNYTIGRLKGSARGTLGASEVLASSGQAASQLSGGSGAGPRCICWRCDVQSKLPGFSRGSS